MHDVLGTSRLICFVSYRIWALLALWYIFTHPWVYFTQRFPVGCEMPQPITNEHSGVRGIFCGENKLEGKWQPLYAQTAKGHKGTSQDRFGRMSSVSHRVISCCPAYPMTYFSSLSAKMMLTHCHLDGVLCLPFISPTHPCVLEHSLIKDKLCYICILFCIFLFLVLFLVSWKHK